VNTLTPEEAEDTTITAWLVSLVADGLAGYGDIVWCGNDGSYTAAPPGVTIQNAERAESISEWIHGYYAYPLD
jgi:hypothetical protein